MTHRGSDKQPLLGDSTIEDDSMHYGGTNDQQGGLRQRYQAKTSQSIRQSTNSLLREPVGISWKNISYTVTVKSGPICRRSVSYKTILNDVSGIVKPGQLLAIIGPSGAGKSSLLDVLAGRKSQGQLEGEVLVNGKPKTRIFKRVSGYVTQDDCLMGNLTVRETFRFHATMKMSGSAREHIEERVQDVIDELGLTKVGDELVGTQFRRGISGGEKKRVSIGCELLTDPGLLFLDEPTTGLDAFNSLAVMKTLQKLASRGRTIICTIHQPRSTIFELFDRLLILSLGRPVYFGQASQAVNYFAQLGAHCRQFINPADFVLDVVMKNEKERQSGNLNVSAAVVPVTSHISSSSSSSSSGDDMDPMLSSTVQATNISKEATHQGEAYLNMDEEFDPTKITQTLAELDLPEYFMQSRLSNNLADDIDSYVEQQQEVNHFADGHTKRFPINFFVQMFYLAQRAIVNLVRNPMLTYIQLFQTLFFGLLVGSIYWQISLNQASIQDRLGALFFIITNQCFATLGSLSVFMEERNIFNREQQAGMYYTSAYFLSKTVVEMPILLLFPAVFGTVAYWMVGFQPHAEEFFIFIAALIVFAAVAGSLFLTIGSFSPNMVVAQILAPLVVVLFLLFGGFYVNNNTIPVWYRWIKYVSFFNWGYAILVNNEFSGLKFKGSCDCLENPICPCCPTDLNATSPTTSFYEPTLSSMLASNDTAVANCVYYTTGDFELTKLDLQDVDIWENFVILVSMVVAYRLLAYIGLRFLYKEKR